MSEGLWFVGGFVLGATIVSIVLGKSTTLILDQVSRLTAVDRTEIKQQVMSKGPTTDKPDNTKARMYSTPEHRAQMQEYISKRRV